LIGSCFKSSERKKQKEKGKKGKPVKKKKMKTKMKYMIFSGFENSELTLENENEKMKK